MSRIDEAWRQVAGSGSHTTGAVARVARLEGAAESVLDDYPREIAPRTSFAERSLPRGGITAPQSVERPLASRVGAIDVRLILSGKAPPIAVEQYRRLAGSLHDFQRKRGLNTVMVTSALPNEGKTLTVANLALTLSESCRDRVLLIDADLRRPNVPRIFGLSATAGLSDVLRSQRREWPILQVTEHLSILPAGHSDEPMAGLTSDQMRLVLGDCSATYDWVLLDAAPIGVMPDAQLLAQLTGAVLFVIEARATPYPLALRALAEIDPEWVLGSVLNGVADHEIPAAGYYRDYYAPPRIE